MEEAEKAKKVKIGCCGFPIRRSEYFREFDAVELQHTFYSIPSIESIKKLKQESLVNRNFEFTVKAFQVITHKISSPTYRRLRERFGDPKHYGSFQPTKEVFEAWEKTREVANALNAKVVLFQTPSSFKEEEQNIKNIKEFFSSIKKEKFIFAWEARGWSEKKRKEICEELGLISAVDPFKDKPFGGVNYFRLHGLPGYNLEYSYSEKDLKKLEGMCNKNENYVFFNNIYMHENALSFKKCLADSCELKKNKKKNAQPTSLLQILFLL